MVQRRLAFGQLASLGGPEGDHPRTRENPGEKYLLTRAFTVGPALSHSNLWDECWRYVMQHASEEVRQLQQAEQRMTGNEGAPPEEDPTVGPTRRSAPGDAEAAGRAKPSAARSSGATTPSDSAVKPTGSAPWRINRRLT